MLDFQGWLLNITNQQTAAVGCCSEPKVSGPKKKGRTRFELVIVFAIIVFKTTALNRSATGPEKTPSQRGGSLFPRSQTIDS